MRLYFCANSDQSVAVFMNAENPNVIELNVYWRSIVQDKASVQACHTFLYNKNKNKIVLYF